MVNGLLKDNMSCKHTKCYFKTMKMHYNGNVNNPKLKFSKLVFKLGVHSSTTTFDVPFNKFQYLLKMSFM